MRILTNKTETLRLYNRINIYIQIILKDLDYEKEILGTPLIFLSVLKFEMNSLFIHQNLFNFFDRTFELHNSY